MRWHSGNREEREKSNQARQPAYQPKSGAGTGVFWHYLPGSRHTASCLAKYSSQSAAKTASNPLPLAWMQSCMNAFGVNSVMFGLPMSAPVQIFAASEAAELRGTQHSWEARMQEGMLGAGWPAGKARRVLGSARHVPAKPLRHSFAPPSLAAALAPASPGSAAWRAACGGEHGGLLSLGVLAEATAEEHRAYAKKHGGSAKAVPPMSLLAAKPGEEGSLLAC